MKNFIRNFLSFFYTKPEPTKEISKEEKEFDDYENENFIMFSIRNGKPIIRINLKSFDVDDPEHFASLLFMSNRGLYQIQIIDMLSDIGVEDPKHAKFVQQILEYWDSFLAMYPDAGVTTESDDDKPCVPPSVFSKIVAGGVTQQ